jgi:catechol 2,3-dioxygenase-like lactoylglutathione lyase family enzyme
MAQRLLSQLAHVEVLTPTPQESLDFYTSVLGLEESAREGQPRLRRPAAHRGAAGVHRHHVLADGLGRLPRPGRLLRHQACRRRYDPGARGRVGARRDPRQRGGPTFVLTPLTRGYFEDPAFREEILERRLPTGRLAELDDIARAVRYLACDASQNVTGHILRVDGGWTAW